MAENGERRNKIKKKRKNRGNRKQRREKRRMDINSELLNRLKDNWFLNLCHVTTKVLRYFYLFIEKRRKDFSFIILKNVKVKYY